MAIPLEAYPLVIGGILLVFIDVFVLLNIAKFRLRFESFVNAFNDTEKREGLFKEIAHGVMRAAGERAGAVKGAASRQSEALLSQDVSGLAISGLASFLPKKYQAFAPLLAPYIQQFMERGGIQNLLPGSQAAGSGQGSGQPP